MLTLKTVDIMSSYHHHTRIISDELANVVPLNVIEVETKS